MAIADSQGPGTAADLNPFRRNEGVTQSVSQRVLSVWSCFEVLRIKYNFCISATSVIVLSIKCDFSIIALL